MKKDIPDSMRLDPPTIIPALPLAPHSSCRCCRRPFLPVGGAMVVVVHVDPVNSCY
jgi:hypothetical protein